MGGEVGSLRGALTPAGRRAWARALRGGVPVDLELPDKLPSDLLPSEIGPLVRTVSGGMSTERAAISKWLAPAGGGQGGPAVTAIIPASRGQPLGVGALAGQDVPVDIHILSNGVSGPECVDGASVFRVPWRGHGRTRQRALEHVETPYVLFTVDDAVVRGAGCVRRLIAALEGGGWDAVVARQVPWPDADPVTRARLREWTPAANGSVPMPQADHVCTLYRTDMLRRRPIPDVPIAEDLVWSVGQRVGLVPDAPVLHSHVRRAWELWRRELAIHRERHQLGLVGSVDSVSGILRSAASGGRLGPREGLRHAAEACAQWWASRG